MITRISVIGIAAITAALIILLSAFNGIEVMIEKLYSEYDTDITIRAAEGKTFSETKIDLEKINAIEGVANTSRATEEVVILKHEKKWVNAEMIGVDPTFLEMTKTSNHMVDGKPMLRSKDESFGLIGATLLDKLDGYIPQNGGYENIICYVPKRDISIRPGKSPFKTRIIKIAGRVNYNREVNAQSFIVPIELSKELLGYSNQVSAIYVDCKNDSEREAVKSKIAELLGEDFTVKTSLEKNELIYKTSRTEKIIVLIILIFIFILAAFNLVASLTMLFVEKLDNIKTMVSFGAHRNLIFKIFFFEGLMVAGKGILLGSFLGYLVCIAQIQFEIVTMPNSGGESFPMSISLQDGLLIFLLVSILSVLFSYIPVKYLISRNIYSSK